MINGDLYKILEIRFTRQIQLGSNYDTVNDECYIKNNQDQEARLLTEPCWGQ